MWKTKIAIVVIIVLVLFIGFSVVRSREAHFTAVAQLPEFVPESVIQNNEWSNEELIDIQGYSADAMEIGISPDGEYLLFNDRVKGNKDMHWATRIDDLSYKYQGRVENTVTKTVDGTPSFDGYGNIYFTTLKTYRKNFKSIYVARFRDGVALDPIPVEGNIYIKDKNQASKIWISLDPDISDDGSMLFYSEGRFNPRAGFPYPFNVRGAEKVNEKFVKIDDRILANVNTDNLEYAPTISSDGLEIFFSRISKVNGRPKFVGIYTATRKSRSDPFKTPEKIMAITGDVEAPVLSGDETRLYYHRMNRGAFRVYRVTRKAH